MPLKLTRGPIVSLDLAPFDMESQTAQTPRRPRRLCPDVQPRVFRTAKVARYLDVSPWTVRRLVADGKLSCLPGKFLRFDRQELDAYIEREKVRM